MIEHAIQNLQNKLFERIKAAFLNQDFATVVSLSQEYLLRDKFNAWVLAYFGYSLFFIGTYREQLLGLDYLKKATKLDPKEAQFHAMIGVLHRDNSSIRSLQHYERALNLDPDCHLAYYGLGIAYFTLGNIEEGINYIIKAISYSTNLKYLEDLNHIIYYDPRFRNPDYKKIAELFYLTAKEKYKLEAINHPLSRYNAKKEKLRIGFFCGEQVNTPTWPFLEKIFKSMNRNKFEFYCYCKPPKFVNLKKEHTNILKVKPHVDKWYYCDRMSIVEVAKQIQNDEIDILIDLSGHLPSYYSYYSEEPTILLFMMKAAPVQITWYGFWGTTGIKEIDYLITAEDNVPPSQDENFTEKVYRLTTGYTHAEIFNSLPDINPEHAFEKNGYITFTSFSRSTKLNSHIFDLWSEILRRVPNSKFLIKYFLMEVSYMTNFIYTNFEKRGIDRSRIIIDPKSQLVNAFISEYNKTDIAFEPLPFGGVTTTINSLTMGVPTIAKYEEDRVTNGGSISLLKAIGCPELCAYSDEQYIQIAVDLANNPEKLKEYKKTLRDRITNSSIKADVYTQSIERAFTDIWEDCCAAKHAEAQMPSS